jgi:tetratricopeptide (TPR) repeat protein
MKKIFIILVISAIAGISLNAQTRNDVIAAYNQGAKAAQTDPAMAIMAFEQAVLLADNVGEEAADLKERVIKVLPGLYVKVALAAYNDNKSATEVISASKKAIAVAEQYGSESNKATAEKILLQGYNKMGTDFFSQNDYENALLAFDSLLLINPGYANALYNKSLIYLRQNDSDAFEETIDMFLGNLEAGKDDERIQQASTLALEYFRASGSRANQQDSLDKALVLLNKAAKYGDNKDLFYYYADVYNKQENFDLGEEFAQKGLDMETGDAEAKAKFYYQLAVAQAGKGNTSAACESFKNALYGPFAEPSKAQRTNLKCQ